MSLVVVCNNSASILHRVRDITTLPLCTYL